MLVCTKICQFSCPLHKLYKETHNIDLAKLLETVSNHLEKVIESYDVHYNGQYKTRTVDHGLLTGYKTRTKYKMRTTD